MGETVNADQAAAWDGDEGQRWAEQAERYERANHRHAARLFAAGVVAAGDAVLDVGCGTGSSTREAARRAGRGSALGVDLSSQMLDRARALSRAEGLTNVRFVHADAQVHPFEPGAYDVAISCFGAMFFDDATAAFVNIGRALRPGGRLALVAWREIAANEWFSEVRAALAVGRRLPEPPPDAPTPYSLADPDRVRRILGDAGYVDVDLAPVDEPVDLGDDADDAYSFVETMGVVKGLVEDLDDAGRRQGLAALRQSIADHAGPDGVRYGSSTWLITARRVDFAPPRSTG